MKVRHIVMALALLGLTACAHGGERKSPACPFPEVLFEGKCMAPMEPQPDREPPPFNKNDRRHQEAGRQICHEAWYENGRYLRRWRKSCPDSYKSHSDQRNDGSWLTTRWFPNVWNYSTTPVRQREFIRIISDPEAYNRHFRIRRDRWVSMIEIRLGRTLRDADEVNRVLSTAKEVKCSDQLLNGKWISRTDYHGEKNDLTFSRTCRPGEYLLLDSDGVPFLSLYCGNIIGDRNDLMRFKILEGSHRRDFL